MIGAARVGTAAEVPAAWVAVFGEAAPSPIAAAVRVPSAADCTGRKLWLIRGSESDGLEVAVSTTCAVVFAGRLQVRPQPADADLVSAGGEDDASAVLRAYLQEGPAALRRLRGRFALLVWDRERDRLVVVRDQLGYYPVFYACVRGALFVSMSADALFRRREVSSELDPVTAASWVGGRWDHATFFRGVSRLPPGHWLLTEEGRVRSERYWRPAVLRDGGSGSWRAVHEQFDLLLSQAVDRCLGPGQAAVFLSGGVDSATIAAVATARSRERGLRDPVALCIEFPGHDVDESAVQRAVVKALGISRVALPFDDEHEPERTLLETLEAASWMPLPPTTSWFSTYYRLARIAAGEGCGTAIGGEGSEWLSHEEAAFAADLLRNMDLGGLHNLFVAERRYTRSPRRRLARRLAWEMSTRVLLRHLAARSLLAVGGEARLSELLVRRQLPRIPFWVAPDPDVRRGVAERWASASPWPQTGSFEERQRLSWLDAPDAIANMDQYLARFQHLGIEWLDGYYDADLIEFLLSIPFELFVAGGRVKSLARASLGRRFPQFDLRLLWAPPVAGAHEALSGGQVRRAFDILGGLPVLAGLGAVDPEPVRRFAAGRGRDPAMHIHQLWYAVSLEAWLQSRGVS